MASPQENAMAAAVSAFDNLQLWLHYKANGANKAVLTQYRRMVNIAIRDSSNQTHPFSQGHGKRSAEYISEAALAQLNAGDGSNLIHEHIYPVKYMKEHVWKNAKNWKNPESIAAFIKEFTLTAIVTKAEDNKLSASGFGTKLPVTDDLFSRYTHPSVNIKLIKRTVEMFEAQKKLLK